MFGLGYQELLLILLLLLPAVIVVLAIRRTPRKSADWWSAPAPPFLSGHRLANWVIMALVANLVISLVSILAYYWQIELLSHVQRGGTITQAEAARNDNRVQALAVAVLITYAAIAILFLAWLHRVTRNLPALGARDLIFSPGWAIGWFFIPFMNLIRPYQAVREIYKASMEPDPTRREKLSTPSVIKSWWGFFLVGGFLDSRTLALSSRAETVDSLLTMSWMSIASEVISACAAILAVLVVRAIDKTQAYASNARPLQSE